MNGADAPEPSGEREPADRAGDGADDGDGAGSRVVADVADVADVGDVPVDVIARALDAAVEVAEAGSRTRPPLPFPSGLKRYFGRPRLTGAARADIRRILVGDDVFRRSLGSVANDEVLDRPSYLWLARPVGWADELRSIAADTATRREQLDLAAELQRSERRRAGAEAAMVRLQAEVLAVRAEFERARVELDARRVTPVADGRVDRARRAELADAVAARRAAESGEARALARAEAADRESANLADRCAALERELSDVSDARDRALATLADVGVPLAAVSPSEVSGDRVDPGEVKAASAQLAGQLAVLRSVVSAVDQIDQRLERLAVRASAGGLAPAAEARTPTPSTISPSTISPSGVAPSGVATSPPRGATTGRRRRAARTPVAVPGGLVGSDDAVAAHLARVPGVVIIVDGYNVAKQVWPDLSLEDQREVCIAEAERAAARHGARVVVVFDGAGSPGAATSRRRTVRVVYSEPGASADDVIRREVGALGADVAVVVVTEDRAVLADVRAAGANTLDVGQWRSLA